MVMYRGKWKPRFVCIKCGETAEGKTRYTKVCAKCKKKGTAEAKIKRKDTNDIRLRRIRALNYSQEKKDGVR
jgi:hypothetical protein